MEKMVKFRQSAAYHTLFKRLIRRNYHIARRYDGLSGSRYLKAYGSSYLFTKMVR